MSIKNTTRDYGTIAKWLHWLTAVLFLGAYSTVYFRQWFTEEKTPENWTALQLHLSIGVTLAVIVALRIIWRVMNKKPNMEPGTKIEHLTAHVGHYALYAVMLLMPITGYLGTSVNTEFFFIFDIEKFDNTALYTYLITDGIGITFQEFEKPIDFIHKNILGAWLVWILILGHIFAALYHHFVKKDRTLEKMTKSK
ncbi:cytochrome b [Shewanella frigidimarina]|uniref:cytochrome b n=1 Tax=Shewanella frigidimarina TaxID=56812 RepID=UPI003D7B4C7C